MKRIVFAGPSLGTGDRARFGMIEFRDPARKGDLIRAALDDASIIGLVDGLFESQPSVWHKEILYCLDRGIVVAGAASMGALRAAECCRFGMIGIGSIFSDYRSGRRSADADVAVLHAPAALGYAALTIALVDVDETARRMVEAEAIDAARAQALCDAARRLHFKERTWEAVLAACDDAGLDRAGFANHLDAHRADLKRDDCRALLEFVRDCELPPQNGRPNERFTLQNSAFLHRLMAAAAASGL